MPSAFSDRTNSAYPTLGPPMRASKSSISSASSEAGKAKLDPEQISGHSTRIGAAQDMLSGGASIGQIMAKVGWNKVDTVMRYVGVGDLSAINSQANCR